MREELALSAQHDGVTLIVWLQPGSHGDEIVGVREGMLRIRVAAPPVRGAANEALVRFLSRQLGLRRGDVEIKQGHGSRRKQVKVYGLSSEEVRTLLR